MNADQPTETTDTQEPQPSAQSEGAGLSVVPGSAPLICLRRAVSNARVCAKDIPEHREGEKRMLMGFAAEVEWAERVLSRQIEWSVSHDTFARVFGALEDLAACQPEADLDEWRRAVTHAHDVLYGTCKQHLQVRRFRACEVDGADADMRTVTIKLPPGEMPWGVRMGAKAYLAISDGEQNNQMSRTAPKENL